MPNKNKDRKNHKRIRPSAGEIFDECSCDAIRVDKIARLAVCKGWTAEDSTSLLRKILERMRAEVQNNGASEMLIQCVSDDGRPRRHTLVMVVGVSC